MMQCACWRQPTTRWLSAARMMVQWASGDAHHLLQARAEPAATSSSNSSRCRAIPCRL